MRKTIIALVTLGLTAPAGPVHAAPRTVTLDIPNASCELCAPIVKKALSRVAGVQSVKVEEGKKGAAATVTFDDAKTTVDALVDASTNAGYPARAVN